MIKANIAMSRPKTLLQWLRIYRLYQSAFPKSEKKPFLMILRMHKKGKTDVWYFHEGKSFAGLAITINGSSENLIDYLAVESSCRGKGVGSAALRLLREEYRGKGIFLEIESAFDECDNKDERVRRRNFYLKNGMKSMGVMAYLFDVKMELLGYDCCLDFKQYHDFYTKNYGEWTGPHIKEAEFPDFSCR